MSYGYEPPGGSHRRADHRTYVVRRVVALTVVAAVVIGVVQVASAVFGAGAPKQVQPGSPLTVTFINDGRTPTTLTPTTTTEPPLKPRTVPSRENPAEVLIIGDSDAASFGPPLEELLQQTGVAAATLEYKTASGLARPDYFDWPTHLHASIADAYPDIVVATFGGNDAQGLRNADLTWVVKHAPGSGLDDTKWKVEYAKRVGVVMDYLSSGNRTLIWVGVPNDNGAALTARLKVQDDVAKAQAARRPRTVVFVDTWAMFSDAKGNWSATAVDPRDATSKPVRAPDGFHLNATGARILALHIAGAVQDELIARGATTLGH